MYDTMQSEENEKKNETKFENRNCLYIQDLASLTSSKRTRNRDELSAASSKKVGSVSVCSTHLSTPTETMGCLTTSNRVGISTCSSA